MSLRPLVVTVLGCALAACGSSRAQDSSGGAAADYSSVIFLRDAWECRFDPLTEHAFEGLLLNGGPPDAVTTAPAVDLGELRLAPRLTATPMTGMADGWEYSSHVTVPAGSAWHGLPLTRMWVEFIAPPETDSLYRRGLSFAASPAEVRKALAAQGQEVPLAPEYRELWDHAPFVAGTCGGSITIEAEAGGAALVCDRGC